MVSEQKLHNTLDVVLHSTPALTAQRVSCNTEWDISEKLFYCLDCDKNGFLDKKEIKLFADATGFDEQVMSWDETYEMLCNEYEADKTIGLDLPSFKFLCSAYLDHDCYLQSIHGLLADLENDEFELGPAHEENFVKSRRPSSIGLRSVANTPHMVPTETPPLVPETAFCLVPSRKNSTFYEETSTRRKSSFYEKQPQITGGSVLTSAVKKLLEQSKNEEEVESKNVLKLRKKLREIEKIEENVQKAVKVDKLQLEKVAKKDKIREELQNTIIEEKKMSQLKKIEDDLNKSLKAPVPFYQQQQDINAYNHNLREAWQRGGWQAIALAGFVPQADLPKEHKAGTYTGQYGYQCV